ncbi:MAG: 23S rRNA (pseudouridine(1915)-N(3))-methyltransferase RlmH [Alphaproteobacteria bacterium]|nr:23S rRNA (pseudouridine(1915)-N(3))-methyltransferase RlmH [Alphaproteobacteria bacterium]
MRIHLAAIGKARPGALQDVYHDFARRLPWKLELKEIELKKAVAATRKKAEETRLLLEACAAAERMMALDEQGELLSSEEFARLLSRWQSAGAGTLGIIIGGADGLDHSQLSRADCVLSFGRATWPHMLVRAMMAEQLYRAYTLLNNHPYHRS